FVAGAEPRAGSAPRARLAFALAAHSARRRRALRLARASAGWYDPPAMKRFFLENYGCQMNVYDTEGMERLLVESGYARTETPAEADVVLVNTCSVREHAEERALNRLSELTRLKDQRPEVVVGRTGGRGQ